MRTGSFVRRMVIGSHPIKKSAWNSFRAIIVGYVCLNHGHIPLLGGINYRVWDHLGLYLLSSLCGQGSNLSILMALLSCVTRILRGSPSTRIS